MTMGTLEIKGLTVMTHIGVHAWEQQILQRLLIDISIPINLSACHDDIANTIDYDKLCQTISAYVESNAFQLIETVTENLIHLIKKTFNIAAFTVSVSKPQAIKNANDVRITVSC